MSLYDFAVDIRLINLDTSPLYNDSSEPVCFGFYFGLSPRRPTND